MIFDCDGVLVDSEVIAYRVFAECLNEAGIVRSVNEAMAFGVGKSARILAAAVEKEFGRSPRENFVETFRARVKAAFTRELKAVEGIIELLAALKLKRCVASNSHIDWVRHALIRPGFCRILRRTSTAPRWSREVNQRRTCFSMPLRRTAFARNGVW